MGDSLRNGLVTFEAQHRTGALRQPCVVLCQASAFRRAFVVLRCPLEKGRVHLAVHFKLTAAQALYADASRKIEEDDQIERIFDLCAIPDNGSTENHAGFGLHVRAQHRESFCWGPLVAERRGGWEPVVVVSI